MIVDERLKTYVEMAPGQYFYGNDGVLYRKLSMDADRNCWDETHQAFFTANPASADKFVTVATDLHLLA